MSAFSSRTAGRYVGTCLVIWSLSALVAEGVFRGRGDQPSADLAGLYVPFGSGGNYKLRPLVDTGATWSTGYFSVHTDELGLRCDSRRRMATKAGDYVDMLFMGDSQGFGNGLSFDDTIVGTIAQRAALEGYVVRNACVGGQLPLNQLELIRDLREHQQLKVSKYVYLFTPLAISLCGGLTNATHGIDGRLYGSSLDRIAMVRTWIKTNSVVYSR